LKIMALDRVAIASPVPAGWSEGGGVGVGGAGARGAGERLGGWLVGVVCGTGLVWERVSGLPRAVQRHPTRYGAGDGQETGTAAGLARIGWRPDGVQPPGFPIRALLRVLATLSEMHRTPRQGTEVAFL
jgi:hypothetical protein